MGVLAQSGVYVANVARACCCVLWLLAQGERIGCER